MKAWIEKIKALIASIREMLGKIDKPDEPAPTDPTPPPTAHDYDLTLRVTAMSRSQVRFAWEPRAYGWPSKDVGGVVCDAIVEMRRADGSGGKFDWIRKGGQAIKGLENIHCGYGGHTVPASGERVTFRWVSVDGKRRSNDAEAVWA